MIYRCTLARRYLSVLLALCFLMNLGQVVGDRGWIVITFLFIHCKNTWVTSTTFSGCLSCIRVTKECYQIGFLEGSLMSFFISYISSSLFSENLLATFLALLPQACNQGTLQGQLCKIKETTNLTRNADL